MSREPLEDNWKLINPGLIQPGSKNLSELGKNAKDEAGKIASDVTSAISGANDRTSQLPRGEGAIESIKGDLVCLVMFPDFHGDRANSIESLRSQAWVLSPRTSPRML